MVRLRLVMHLRVVDRGLQPIEAHRFNQMMQETDVVALLHIFVEPVAGNGDCVDGLALANFPEKIKAIAIRQANVREQKVKLLLASNPQRLRHRGRESDMVAEAAEKQLQSAGGILVIFHHQDAERRVLRRERRHV